MCPCRIPRDLMGIMNGFLVKSRPVWKVIDLFNSYLTALSNSA